MADQILQIENITRKHLAGGLQKQTADLLIISPPQAKSKGLDFD
jgi:hypothetical protein